LVLKALDRDPDKRFQTARELADALTKALVPTVPAARGIRCRVTMKAWWSTSLMEKERPAAQVRRGVGPAPSDGLPPTCAPSAEGAATSPSNRAPRSQTASAEASSGKASRF